MPMRKYIFPLMFLAVFAIGFVSCKKEDKDKDKKENYWTKYADWRVANTDFFEAKYGETDSQGNLTYARVTPSWDASSTILMRWYNDRALTEDSVRPYSTSYVDVIYEGRNYEGTVFDSSARHASDSIYRTKVSDNIKGWIIALTNMRVGDRCEVVIPQDCGYGNQYTSDLIMPYSTLIFDIELKGVPGLEKPVN